MDYSSKGIAVFTTFFTLSITSLWYGIQKIESMLIYPSNVPEGSRENVDTPAKYNLPFKNVTIKTIDNQTLQAYVLTHDPTSKDYKNLTVVMYGPNAGNIGHTLPLVEALYNKLGYNVVTWSYRGYGRSTGYANERGIKIDAQTVLRYLADHPIIGKSKLVLYGRSLGGAVAIYTASLPLANGLVAGIALENTFLSIHKLVPVVLPLLSRVAFLVSQKWDSENTIKDIPSSVNLLFLSGARDELVPPAQHKALFDLSPSKHKFFKSLPEGTHNDTVIQEDYWTDLNKFCVICETNSGSLDSDDDEGLDVGLTEEELAQLVSDDPSAKPGSDEKLSWIPVTDVEAVKAASITNIRDTI